MKGELTAAKASELSAHRELEAARQGTVARERDHSATLTALREELHGLRLELRAAQDAAAAAGSQLRGETQAAQEEIATLTVKSRELEAQRRAAEKQVKVGPWQLYCADKVLGALPPIHRVGYVLARQQAGVEAGVRSEGPCDSCGS